MITARRTPGIRTAVSIILVLLGVVIFFESLAQESKSNMQTEYTQEVIRLLNVEREEAGLNPLTYDITMQAMADHRAEEASRKFSHTRPDGSSWKTIFSDYQMQSNYRGENLAFGQKSPSKVMKAWMASKGHKANILNARFTNIAVGLYVKNGVLYWSQMFMEAADPNETFMPVPTADPSLPTPEPVATMAPQPTLTVELPKGAMFGWVDGVNLNLRASPTSKSEVLEILPADTQLIVIKIDGKWAEVELMTGQKGYVNAPFLRYQ